MFDSVLVANRGEIARRVTRSAKRLGLRTIAVYSDADRGAWHVADADEAYRIGGSAASESYLNIEAILEAARRAGAEAIHPGYGFLSERAAFADACEQAGLVFVGPPASAIRAMGLKDAAKDIVAKAGVPVVPGYQGDRQDAETLRREAGAVGYPILIKAVAGGGGKGMRRVDAEDEFLRALEGAKREAKSAFGDDRVLIEKFVPQPRHIEVQVFADAHGGVVHLFERDCSLQRRHQKVIEEAPAPGMTPELRQAMGEAATEAARAIGYRGAGTIEFIVDSSAGLEQAPFYFMEMNTRLQVEHPVTEAITGLDLVEWQFRVAAGERLPPQEQLAFQGHAIEARLYAEDPLKGFLPSTGRLRRLRLPDTAGSVRVDAGVRQGDDVTMFYDPMIAKIIAHGPTRDEARRRLARAFDDVEVAGVRTNARFVADCLRQEAFARGEIDTGFIDRHLGDLARRTAPSVEAQALAGLAVLFWEDRNAHRHAAGSPWMVNDSFRIGGGGFDVVAFAKGPTDAFEVRLERQPGAMAASVGSWQVDARLEWSGERLVGTLGGTKIDVWAEVDPAAVTLILRGETLMFPRPDPFAEEDAATSDAATIVAPMPGRILQVHVAEGQRVRRGMPLIVLEAMKMEHTLTSPLQGSVGKLHAQMGDQVAEGALLIDLVQDQV